MAAGGAGAGGGDSQDGEAKDAFISLTKQRLGKQFLLEDFSRLGSKASDMYR